MNDVSFIPTSSGKSLGGIFTKNILVVKQHLYCCFPYVTAAGLDIITNNMNPKVEYKLITRLNDEDIINKSIDPVAIARFIENGGHVRFHDKSLHAKLWIADGDVSLGSMNLTGPGLNNNIELIASLLDASNIQVNLHDWFLTLWGQLQGSEKSPDELRTLANKLMISGYAERIRRAMNMKGLKDYGHKSLSRSNIIEDEMPTHGWFKVNGTSDEDRIDPGFNLGGLAAYEGAQTFSKKGRPRWVAGEKVILAYLAKNENNENDYCIYGRGTVSNTHRQGVDEIPDWLIPGKTVSLKDYEDIIARWPYIVWLRDLQIVDGFACDALWLTEINERSGKILVSPSSTRNGYVKLGEEQLGILDSYLDHLFESGQKLLYLSDPDQVWWNTLIKDPKYYVTKSRLERSVV